MAANFTNINLENGQEVILPFEVTGEVTAVAPAASITHVAYQIDDHDLHDIGNDGLPPFGCSIPVQDCPTPGAWYLLTIYAWDNDGTVTTESRTFKRSAETFSTEIELLPPPPGP